MTDYTKLLLEKHTALAEEFYDLLLETANDESEYLLACLENNIILEADENQSGTGQKKVGWFRKLIEVVKALFEKFFNKNTGLIKENEKWLNENKDVFKNINYEQLKAKVQLLGENAKNDLVGIPTRTEKMIDLKYANSSKFESKEDVENFGEFQKIKIKDKSFAESCKIRFYGGTKDIPEPVVLAGNELKKFVINGVLPFVTLYKNDVKELQQHIDYFSNRVKNIENELKRRGETLESFCILENCTFDDTDLRYCYNYHIVKEESSDDKKEEQKPTDDKDMKVNSVVNTNVESEKSDNLKYLRYAIQLHQTVLTTWMSTEESLYINYMALLKNIKAQS